MKRLLIWAGIITALLGPANAAGTVPGFSLTPQFDSLGKVAPGCKLYVIQAGTTSTPQNSYQDSALTALLPNPMTCDATGRLPQWFVADGLIKVRLTDKNGVQLFVGDNLLVVGPSGGGGGGGGGTIDPTTILATGDIKLRYGTGVLTGFVRQNGRTIGSATSGATERANADAQPLFEYLWGADSNLVVSTGRGASANADWVANKTITLPDARGRSMFGMDDMGNAAIGRLTSVSSGCNGILLGASCGVQTKVIAQNQLPNYSPVFTGDLVNVSSTSVEPQVLNGASAAAPGFGAGGNVFTVLNGGAGATAIHSNGLTTPTGTITSINGGVSQVGLPVVPPLMVVTIYQKL